MTESYQFLEIAINILNVLGLGLSVNTLYQLIAIFIIGWLSLCAFLIVRKPHALEKWKYPDMANISTIAIVSVLGYVVSYLVVTNAYLLGLFDVSVKNNPPTFIVIIFTMVLYTFGLFYFLNDKNKNPHNPDEHIPIETKSFIKKSLLLSVSLGFFIFAQAVLLTINKINSPFYISTLSSSMTKSLIAFSCFLFLGVGFLIMALKESIIKKLDDYVADKSKKIVMNLKRKVTHGIQ